MKKISCEICYFKTCRLDNTKRRFMARFPLDEDRCKLWVQKTGKEDLVYVPIEKLHQLKFICGNHFKPKDFKKKKTQLKKNAVPSIDITSKPLPDEMFIDFPLHLAKHYETDKESANETQAQYSNYDFSATTDHNYYTLMPSTSTLDTNLVDLERSCSPRMELDITSTMDIDQHCDEISVQGKPEVPSLYLYQELEEDLAPLRPVTASQTTNACCKYSKFLEQYEKFNLQPNEKQSSTKHQVKVLEHDNLVYKKRIYILLNTQEKLKLRIKELEAKLLTESEDFIAKVKRLFAHVLTSNQVDTVLGEKTQVQWTDDEYTKAYNLRLLSKNAYFYMRETLIYPLPSISSLLNWASKLDGNKPNYDQEDTVAPLPKPIKLRFEENKEVYSSREDISANDLNDCDSIELKDTSDIKCESGLVSLDKNEKSDQSQSQIKIQADTKNTDENGKQDSNIYEQIDYIDDDDNNNVDEHICTVVILGNGVNRSRSDVKNSVEMDGIVTDVNEFFDNDNGIEKRDEYFKEFVG